MELEGILQGALLPNDPVYDSKSKMFECAWQLHADQMEYLKINLCEMITRYSEILDQNASGYYSNTYLEKIFDGIFETIKSEQVIKSLSDSDIKKISEIILLFSTENILKLFDKYPQLLIFANHFKSQIQKKLFEINVNKDEDYDEGKFYQLLVKLNISFDINSVTADGQSVLVNMMIYCNADDLIKYLDANKPDLSTQSNAINFALSGFDIKSAEKLILKLIEYKSPLKLTSLNNLSVIFNNPYLKSLYQNILSTYNKDVMTRWLYDNLQNAYGDLAVFELLNIYKSSIDFNYINTVGSSNANTLLEECINGLIKSDQSALMMIDLLGKDVIDFSIHTHILSITLNPKLFNYFVDNGINLQLCKLSPDCLITLSKTPEGRESISRYLSKLQSCFPNGSIPDISQYIEIDPLRDHIHTLDFDSLDFLIEKFNLRQMLYIEDKKYNETISDKIVMSFKKNDLHKFLDKYNPDLSKLPSIISKILV